MRTTAVAALAALSLITAAGCASSGGARPDTAAELPLAVIDAHLHTNFYDRLDPDSLAMDSRDGLAEEMQQNHVVGAEFRCQRKAREFQLFAMACANTVVIAHLLSTEGKREPIIERITKVAGQPHP